MVIDLSGEKIVKNRQALFGERTNLDTYYQKLHDYFYVEAENVNRTYTQGTELDFLYLLDATTLDLPDILASGIQNYLTPPSTKWFSLQHPNKEMQAKKEVRQWMQDTTDELGLILNRSNFYNQTPIFYKSSGVYGTSILMLEEDDKDLLRFYNLPIKNCYIVDDAREKPLEYYLIFEYTAEQAFSKFGDLVDKTVKKALTDTRAPDKKFTYIYYLGPRQDIEISKQTADNMPIRGVWVEEKSKNIMKEDGFEEMPAVAHRFFKRPQLAYGFSPGMKCLPWARMLQTISDTVVRAAMKQTDPAIAMPDNGFLAPMNLNPRAINYYKRGQLDPQKDVVPIGNFGNVNIGMAEIEYYAEQAGKMFYKNAFLAFQDITKQMTVPEVMQRQSESLTLLGPAVGRYMSDVLQPVVERCIGMLSRAGRLPPLPDDMMLDPQYDVKFVGRLAQSQQQSEINNLTNALSIAGQVAEFKPEALDKINADATIDEIWGLTGAPAGSIYDQKEVDEIREARAQQQQMVEQMEMAQQAASVGKDAAAAEKSTIEAEAVGA